MKLTKSTIRGFAAGIGVFLVVKITLGALSEPKPKAYSRDDTIALINTTVAKDMYASLLAYFPADAGALVDEMQSVLNTSKSTQGASDRILSSGATIRIKYAPFLAKAPDATLKEILSFQVGLHKAFLDRPLVCNALLMQGGAGLSLEDRQVLAALPIIPEGTRLQFKAMAQGRDNPTEHGTVNDETYDLLFDGMIEGGLPEEQFADFENPDVSSPTMCANYISFFEHIRDAEFEGAAAMRAQMVADMLST